jgi:aspartyl-tRNA(Asn)/glutamyl-tRNA(Gln) amidotransferase subunit B
LRREELHGWRWIDICDGNMEEGSFRCDANVSGARGRPHWHALRDQELTARFMQEAIEFEVHRRSS